MRVHSQECSGTRPTLNRQEGSREYHSQVDDQGSVRLPWLRPEPQHAHGLLQDGNHNEVSDPARSCPPLD
jgi:hypothetical protein